MSLARALISYAQSSGKDSSALLRALAQRDAPRRPLPPGPVSRGSGTFGAAEVDRPEGPGYPSNLSSGLLTLPTQWKGTHDTSGADWNNNAATAADIMAKAGTWVGAPEPGRIVRQGSAQGGSSVYFDPDAPGANYWIGHIDNVFPVGYRARRRGQRIARVSADHPAPHVHIDRTN